MKIVSRAATPAYRNGWVRVFAAKRPHGKFDDVRLTEEESAAIFKDGTKDMKTEEKPAKN